MKCYTFKRGKSAGIYEIEFNAASLPSEDIFFTNLKLVIHSNQENGLSQVICLCLCSIFAAEVPLLFLPFELSISIN
jgi:hypothetical protein